MRRGSIDICARDSIWNVPIVSALRIIAYVAGSSAGMVARSRRMAFGLIEQIEGAAHAAQHAEAQHIDLHEFQRVDIVLVPFDHLPVFHRGGFDRDQLIKPIERQDEAARMLREMARRADQLLAQAQASA